MRSSESLERRGEDADYTLNDAADIARHSTCRDGRDRVGDAVERVKERRCVLPCVTLRIYAECACRVLDVVERSYNALNIGVYFVSRYAYRRHGFLELVRSLRFLLSFLNLILSLFCLLLAFQHFRSSFRNAVPVAVFQRVQQSCRSLLRKSFTLLLQCSACGDFLVGVLNALLCNAAQTCIEEVFLAA